MPQLNRLLLVLIVAFSLVPSRSSRGADDAPHRQWDLESLSLAPEFSWKDEKSPVRSLFYSGEHFHGQPTRVFAYYASPATLEKREPKPGEKFPAVVLVHGGGGTAFAEWCDLWAKRGYAAISMDLAGRQPQPTDDEATPDATKRPRVQKETVRLPDGGPDQDHGAKFGHMAEPKTEHWTYHAVANVVRAHSLVRSFPEVDADHTAVTGISWGGYLTCIVSGVDNRFKAAVPVYGCGFLYENSSWLGDLAGLSDKDRQLWIDRYDPSHALADCRTPIFFVNGTNDFHYRIAQWQKSTEQPKGDVNRRLEVNMAHSHPAGWAPQEIGLFIDAYCKAGQPLPKVGPPEKEASGALTFAVNSATKLTKAELHWTTDDLQVENKDRRWQTAPANLEGSRITTAPPAGALIWFVTVTDERGAMVSSGVQFAGH